MGEARNFSSWGDAHSHGLTILKMWRRLLLLPPCYNAPRHKQKIFPVTPTEEEIASRKIVGWAVTEVAELGHALNNLWPWAGRQDGSLTDLGRGLGERSNPTCAYSNTPSFSFCHLYSTIFCIIIFRKRTEKTSLELCCFTFNSHHTHIAAKRTRGWENLPVRAASFFPSSMHWNDYERRKRPCKSPGDQKHITFCALLPMTRIPQVCKREICEAWSWVQEWNKLLSCRRNW